MQNCRQISLAPMENEQKMEKQAKKSPDQTNKHCCWVAILDLIKNVKRHA